MEGLIWQDVERIASFAEADKTIAGLRDSAMIRLMSDCLLRVSEVVVVNVEDLNKTTLTVRQSKTDQEGHGESLYVCTSTRRVIKQYRQKAAIERGVLFRQIRRGDHVQSDGLTDFSARRIIQKRSIDAGVEGFISGHSLRVGSAVSLARAGASVVDMQVAGRWKSSQMPALLCQSRACGTGCDCTVQRKERQVILMDWGSWSPSHTILVLFIVAGFMVNLPSISIVLDKTIRKSTSKVKHSFMP